MTRFLKPWPTLIAGIVIGYVAVPMIRQRMG